MPTRNDTRVPTRMTPAPLWDMSAERPPSRMSLAICPKISGSTIRNEKRAASPRSTLQRTEVDIVVPERDSPGRMAKACERPMISALANDTFRVVSRARPATSSRAAVRMSMEPTSRTLPSKSRSM